MLLDFLFPKCCVVCRAFGSYICSNFFATLSFDVHTVCFICNRASLDGKTRPDCLRRFTIDGSIAGLVYTMAVQKLIYTFKYKPYVTDLRSVLGELFYEALIQKQLFHLLLQQESMLVSIPLHPTKFRARGYNQAAVLAEGLAKQCKLPMKTIYTG